MNGAAFLVEALLQEGVDTVFGYPGGAVIPIFDVLYSEKRINVILTRHEQAAVHAADGYARVSGKPGVCIVTSGPGATNTITGLATANFDSVPLVCISGQVPRNMIGNDAFQEADTVGITRPVTKHNYLITDRKTMGISLKEAFHISNTGRPGPVVVDIPKDILLAEDNEAYPESVSIRGYQDTFELDIQSIQNACEKLMKAEKPLFYIGGGLHISGAAKVFNTVMRKTGVPVISSLLGIGIVEQNDPLNCGMIGMHGTYTANMAVSECDLLFALGTRFDDRATGNLAKFAQNARIIHVDIDDSAINRNVPVEIPIVADAREVLEAMEPLVDRSNCKSWVASINGWRKEHPMDVISHSDGTLSPTYVIDQISRVFPDGIIATEVGQNQMWAALYYKFKHPRSWLTSGGLGTMGYGFPAAIGAQFAAPSRRVIDIAGDGSIQMNIQELATAVIEEVPVIICILNNGYLGMVRQWQEIFHNKRYSSTCLKRRKNCRDECMDPGGKCPVYIPDFVALAQSYGALGLRVEREEDVGPALKKAAETTDRPIVIDFIIKPEENVYPMVSPGSGNNEMIFKEVQ